MYLENHGCLYAAFDRRHTLITIIEQLSHHVAVTDITSPGFYHATSRGKLIVNLLRRITMKSRSR